MNKPAENAPITEALSWYAEYNPTYGKRLAKTCDYLEDCYAYSINFEEEHDS